MVRLGVKEFGSKLSKILLIGILVLIPTQWGKSFWFDWGSILGIKIDYVLPTVYLIDLLWLGLFISKFSITKFQVFQTNFKNQLPIFQILLVVIFILINILITQNKWLAIYKWLRLGELFWFGWYVYKNKKRVREILIKVIPFWIIIESTLALGQIAKGESLNGWYWWLGEKTFNFNAIEGGRNLIKAYGTFSNSVSLAGFLLVELVWWIKIKIQNPLSLDKFGTFPLKRATLKNIYWWGVFWLGLMGIFLTGNQIVWILTLGVIIFWMAKNSFKTKAKIKFGLLFLILTLGLIKIVDFNYPLKNFLGGWNENEIIKRGQLNLVALKMIKESPWLGVGLGNNWLEPVHNIFLLLVVEMGILGLMIVIWWLAKIKWNNLEKWNGIILGIIFITGMIDNYWFTSPQNMWLLTLVLGII